MLYEEKEEGLSNPGMPEMKSRRLEKVLWSVALPGFGQFLNRHYVKGITLLLLEFVVNVQSHLNEVIILSFHGEIKRAIAETNYQWLMFYPCLYMFGIYDAYKYGSEVELRSFTYLPAVLAAFFATVGLTFSANLRIMGGLLGPIWLTILFCIIGIGFGIILMKQLQKADA